MYIVYLYIVYLHTVMICCLIAYSYGSTVYLHTVLIQSYWHTDLFWLHTVCYFIYFGMRVMYFGTVFSDGGRPERVNHLELNTALSIPYKRVYSSVAIFCGFQVKRIERRRWSYTSSSIVWLRHF